MLVHERSHCALSERLRRSGSPPSRSSATTWFGTRADSAANILALPDRRLWQDAARNDDPFSDAAGVRLAKTTLHKLWMGWRGFLGFLSIHQPTALEIAPAE